MLKRYTRISIAINEFNFYIITIILIFIQQVAILHYESNYIHFIIIIIKRSKMTLIYNIIFTLLCL